nr:hypothetical protein [uncultured Actinoplanes sp.]
MTAQSAVETRRGRDGDMIYRRPPARPVADEPGGSWFGGGGAAADAPKSEEPPAPGSYSRVSFGFSAEPISPNRQAAAPARRPTGAQPALADRAASADNAVRADRPVTTDEFEALRPGHRDRTGDLAARRTSPDESAALRPAGRDDTGEPAGQDRGDIGGFARPSSGDTGGIAWQKRDDPGMLARQGERGVIGEPARQGGRDDMGGLARQGMVGDTGEIAGLRRWDLSGDVADRARGITTEEFAALRPANRGGTGELAALRAANGGATDEFAALRPAIGGGTGEVAALRGANRGAGDELPRPGGDQADGGGERHPAVPQEEPHRRSKLFTAGVVLLSAAVLLVGSIVGVAYFSGSDDKLDDVLQLGADDGAGTTVSAPLENRTKAGFELLAGANVVRLRIGELGDDLYRISTPDDAGIRPSPQIRNDDVKLQVTKDGDGTGGELDVVLAAKVHWSLRFSGYVERQLLDLTGGQVTGIEMVAGTRKAEVVLSRPSGTVPVKINGAVEELVLTSPSDSPVRIRVDGGAKTVVAGRRTIKDVAAGSTLTPKNWATQNRYDVAAGARITSLTVESA